MYDWRMPADILEMMKRTPSRPFASRAPGTLYETEKEMDDWAKRELDKIRKLGNVDGCRDPSQN